MLVDVDAIRTDILHPCDIAEDIAIAHNYNKSKKIIFSWKYANLNFYNRNIIANK